MKFLMVDNSCLSLWLFCPFDSFVPLTLLSLRLFDPVALLPPCLAACDYAGSSMAKVVPTPGWLRFT